MNRSLHPSRAQIRKGTKDLFQRNKDIIITIQKYTMQKHRYKVLICLSGILGIGLWACTDELKINDKGTNEFVDIQPVKLQATIYFEDYETLGEVKTRFSTDYSDNWSIGGSSTTFTDKDTVGIFSRWGNMNLPTSDGRGGPLFNIPMYFVGQQYPKDPNKPDGEQTTAYTLENDTVEVYPPAMKTGYGVYMYYPYTKDIGTIDNYPNWKGYVEAQNLQTSSVYWGTGYAAANNVPGNTVKETDEFPIIPGLELRVKAPDGSVRCREVVEMNSANSTDLTKGIISGAVYHAFGELIIMRGTGFDKPVKRENGQLVPDSTIYVVLDTPITHLSVVSYLNTEYTRWTTKPFYKEGYIFDGKEMDEEEACKWYAWKGTNYENDYGVPKDDSVDAWYVIIPTVYQQNTNTSTNRLYTTQYNKRPTVQEIVLYDNEGILQHVNSFTLKTSDTANPTKQIAPRYRWPIEVAMTELGPTVRPVTIDKWDEDRDDKDITDIRTSGIHDMEEYKTWAATYNSYISGGRTNPSGLEKFGDLIDNVWHFYVSDFDFKGGTLPAEVTDLQDIIEGDNQFYNVVWSNLNLFTPIFNTISYRGGIRNIDFDHPFLNYEGDDPVGIFAKEISLVYSTGSEEQTFENCNIYNGRVISNGPVGMLAGKINFGRFSDCEFTGDIIGDSTATTTPPDPANLFGEEPKQKLTFNNIISKIMFGTR